MKPGVLIAVVCVFAAACVSNLDRGVRHFANQEYDMAAKYWNPSAKSGNPYAQYNLGLLWESGLGSTPKDSEQAILWYLKSARQGFPLAMVRAADLQYQLGYEEAALSWFTLAARWGNDDAVGALRKLGKPVPQADLLQAQIAREQREAEEQGSLA